MQVLDKGHKYLLDELDGDGKQLLTFVKREGEKFPGNIGHYPGVIIQEVLRALIDRFEYLNTQIPCDHNTKCLMYLRNTFFLLEDRAAERHGMFLDVDKQVRTNIELCPVGPNGHILQGAGSVDEHKG